MGEIQGREEMMDIGIYDIEHNGLPVIWIYDEVTGTIYVYM
jgi:hypothetical protein